MLFRSGRNINNLRYADDNTFMAESKEELKSLLMKEKGESKKASRNTALKVGMLGLRGRLCGGKGICCVALGIPASGFPAALRLLSSSETGGRVQMVFSP